MGFFFFKEITEPKGNCDIEHRARSLKSCHIHIRHLFARSPAIVSSPNAKAIQHPQPETSHPFHIKAIYLPIRSHMDRRRLRSLLWHQQQKKTPECSETPLKGSCFGLFFALLSPPSALLLPFLGRQKTRSPVTYLHAYDTENIRIVQKNKPCGVCPS